MSLRDGQNCIITTGVVAIRKSGLVSYSPRAVDNSVFNRFDVYVLTKFRTIGAQFLRSRVTKNFKKVSHF